MYQNFHWIRKSMKNDKLHKILLIIAILFMVVSWVTLYCEKTSNNVEKIDTVFQTKTDTIFRDTTITIKELVPKIIVKKKVDTLYTEKGDTVQLTTESKRYDETIINEADTADISVYTTGINTQVDSVALKLKTHTNVITNTIEITKYIEKKKTFWDRFHFGIQGGVGYGLTQKKVDVYLGLGGSFDL